MSAIAIWAVFSVITLLASDEPWQEVVPIWLVIAIVIAIWSLIGGNRHLKEALCRLESALVRDEARVVRIVADAMVELAEVEDEGACYAFQVEDELVVFVSGQEFYASAKFPNSDFSIASILDESGTEVEMFIEKHGVKLRPIRVIAAENASKLRRPEHLEVIECQLERLESCLAV